VICLTSLAIGTFVGATIGITALMLFIARNRGVTWTFRGNTHQGFVADSEGAALFDSGLISASDERNELSIAGLLNTDVEVQIMVWRAK
jgi:hypothetical protein